MRPLVLLWGCLVLPGYGALTGPKKVRGFEGDTLSLQCTYGEELRSHQKYWCRKTRTSIIRCSGVYTRADGQESTEGRVSIRDSPQELRFYVTLRELTLEDSGEYWCGVKILGFDETFIVTLIVLPGPCCPPSPTPFFQPLATSLQPKAKAWPTQPPAQTFPGVHPRVTTAKRGKTEAEASLLTGTSPSEHTGTSLYTGTTPRAGAAPRAGTAPPAGVALRVGTAPRAGTAPCEQIAPCEQTTPYEQTSPHTATSPRAGTSGLSPHPDSTSAKVAGLLRSSRSSKSRVCPTTVRILAPVLVLLSLLLTSGLCALGRYLLRWRKKVQLATETQRNEKVYHSLSVPESAVINAIEAPTGPAVSPCTETHCLGQTSEQEEASFQDPEGEAHPGPPFHMAEELRRSVFISV